MNFEELLSEIGKTEAEILQLTMAIRLGQEKDVAKKKKIRTYLARLKTSLTQRTMNQEDTSQEPVAAS